MERSRNMALDSGGGELGGRISEESFRERISNLKLSDGTLLTAIQAPSGVHSLHSYEKDTQFLTQPRIQHSMLQANSLYV